MEERITYCRICEAYCGLIVTVDQGRVVRIRPGNLLAGTMPEQLEPLAGMAFLNGIPVRLEAI